MNTRIMEKRKEQNGEVAEMLLRCLPVAIAMRCVSGEARGKNCTVCILDVLYMYSTTAPNESIATERQSNNITAT